MKPYCFPPLPSRSLLISCLTFRDHFLSLTHRLHAKPAKESSSPAVICSFLGSLTDILLSSQPISRLCLFYIYCFSSCSIFISIVRLNQFLFFYIYLRHKSQICYSAPISLLRMEDYRDFDVEAAGVPYGDGGRYKKGLNLGTCHLAPDQRRFKQKMFPYASVGIRILWLGTSTYHHILVDCK